MISMSTQLTGMKKVNMVNNDDAHKMSPRVQLLQVNKSQHESNYKSTDVNTVLR